MIYKMTQEKAEQYALRMYNDDCWDKNYAPDVEALKLVKDHKPPSMKVEDISDTT